MKGWEKEVFLAKGQKNDSICHCLNTLIVKKSPLFGARIGTKYFKKPNNYLARGRNFNGCFIQNLVSQSLKNFPYGIFQKACNVKNLKHECGCRIWGDGGAIAWTPMVFPFQKALLVRKFCGGMFYNLWGLSLWITVFFQLMVEIMTKSLSIFWTTPHQDVPTLLKLIFFYYGD